MLRWPQSRAGDSNKQCHSSPFSSHHSEHVPRRHTGLASPHQRSCVLSGAGSEAVMKPPTVRKLVGARKSGFCGFSLLCLFPGVCNIHQKFDPAIWHPEGLGWGAEAHRGLLSALKAAAASHGRFQKSSVGLWKWMGPPLASLNL